VGHYSAGLLGAQNRAVSSTWDGVYTLSQAGRGQQQYDASCASCHSEDLSGGEARPGLINTTCPGPNREA
jgi:mono/diheme cytochrome c family protein